jgi:hypothetical protein
MVIPIIFNPIEPEDFGIFVKESVVIAESIVDRICEKGAFCVYDRYLRTKDKPFGITRAIQSLGEMLQVTTNLKYPSD